MSKARYAVNEDPPIVEYWKDTTQRIDRVRKQFINVIPTDMPPIDDLIGGGLPRGALGMIMAGSGHGKTAMLGQLALSGSLQGYKVAYITLELSADGFMLRCDANNANIPQGELLTAKRRRILDNISKVYKSRGTPPGALYVQYYPTKSISVAHVETFVERLREETGDTLDLLLVDYFDLMKMTGKYDKKYEALEENIEILRGIAGKFKLACWTASQINRGGISKETVDMDDIASGFGKVFPLDLLLAVSQTAAEKRDGIFRLNFAKNRHGPAGKIVFVRADFERMKFVAMTEAEAASQGIYTPRKTTVKGSSGPATKFGSQGP